MTDPTARLSAMAQEVASDPGSPVYPELASALVEAGRYDEAVGVCERGLQASPLPAGRRVLAEALLLLGDLEGARRNVEEVLEDEPDDPAGLRVLGEVLLASGDPGAASMILRRSARLDPSDMRTLDLLARVPEQDEEDEHDALGALEQEGAPEGVAPGAVDEVQSRASSLEPALPFEAAPEPAPSAEPEPDPFEDLGEPSKGEATPSYELDLPEPEPDPAPDSASMETPDEGPLELDLPGDGPGPAPAPEPDDGPFADIGSTSGKAAEPSPEAPSPPSDLKDEPGLQRKARGVRGGAGGIGEAQGSFAARASDGPPDLKTPSTEAEAATAMPRARTASRVQPMQRPTISADLSKLPLAGRLIALLSTSKAAKPALAGGTLLVLLIIVATLVSSWKKERDETAFAAAMAYAAAAIERDTEPGYREAIVHLEEALERRPDDPETLGLLAFSATRLYTAFDAGPDAVVLAEDYLAVAEAQPFLTPEASAARGLLHLAEGRPADAVTSVASALADDPRHAALLWVRAQAQLELDRMDLAVEGLGQAVERDPSFLPAATLLAHLLMETGEPAEAHAIRREIVSRNPDHLATLLAIVDDATSRRAAPAEVLEVLRASSGAWASLPPESICRLQLGTARVALLADRPDLATEAENLARAIEVDAGCQVSVGHHLLRRHRPMEAYQALSRAAAQGEKGTRGAAARAALEAGRPELALDLLSPEGGLAEQALRARALYEAGRVREAIEAAREAARGQEAGPEALATLVLISSAEGDVVEARRTLRRIRPVGLEDEAAVLVGRAFLALGDSRRASAALQGVLRAADSPSYAMLVTAARAAAAAGQVPLALRRLESALLLNPDAETALEMYLHLAPHERATRRLSTLPPPWAPAFQGLAHLAADDIPAAREMHELAASEGEGYWVELLEQSLRVAENDLDPASLRELIAANQGRMMPRLLLADALFALGRPAEAAECLRDGLKRNAEHATAMARLSEAHAIVATDPPAAVRDARTVLRLLASTPADSVTQARAHASLALACASAGDARCARRAAVQARRRAPTDGRVLFLVGRALELSGDLRQARATYRLASELPGGEEALLRFAFISRGPAATSALESFLERAPRHALAGQARQALSSGP